jgi:hypothetical protein
VKKQNTPCHKTVHPTVDKPMVLENGGESFAIGFNRKLSPQPARWQRGALEVPASERFKAPS